MDNEIDEPVWFRESRLLEDIKGAPKSHDSRLQRERKKTVSVAIVLCLNIGVDPPDITKPANCARLECWLDPNAINLPKALEEIGQTLQKQYERWQPRARYKLSLDPTVEDVKKLCVSLRRNAKEERVLFHYNGHGVPKPTTNGEIWVFNKTYTQYIPLSIFDLQSWMGAPSIFVYDCSNAGVIADSFLKFAEQHDREYYEKLKHPATTESGQTTEQQQQQQPGSSVASTETQTGGSGSVEDLCGGPGPPNFKQHCIQLAACQRDQLLPMNAELPADLFTSCLTTPIKVRNTWWVGECGRLVWRPGSAQLQTALYPTRSMSTRSTPSHECRTTCGSVHILSHYSYKGKKHLVGRAVWKTCLEARVRPTSNSTVSNSQHVNAINSFP